MAAVVKAGVGVRVDKDALEAGGAMDEDEIEDQGLLSEEEDDNSPPIVLDFDAAGSAAGHQFVILGRFLSVRGYSFMGLFDAMKNAWRLTYAPDVKRLRDNRFLIELRSEGDKNYVLQGGPWIYRGDPLLVADYDGKLRPSDVVLNWMPIWIQIEDMPLNLMNEGTGQILGSNVGKVVAVGRDSKGRFWDDHMRIRVLLPVDKALTRWLKVKDEKTGDTLRLHVKYERIPKFCRYCGHVGHVEKDCLLPEKERKVRFGLHLRASPKKKFVTPNPERQGTLAKRNLNFDDQDDNRRRGGNQEKEREGDTEKKQSEVSKHAAPEAIDGAGKTGVDAAKDITQKVLALGIDTPSVAPRLLFQGGLQAPAGGARGEEVGDNGLEPLAPVKSILHEKVAAVACDVAREWEKRMIDSRHPKVQRHFNSSHFPRLKIFSCRWMQGMGLMWPWIQFQQKFVECVLSVLLYLPEKLSGLLQSVGVTTLIPSCGKLFSVALQF
jgi:hypothetical protein